MGIGITESGKQRIAQPHIKGGFPKIQALRGRGLSLDTETIDYVVTRAEISSGVGGGG